MQTSNSGRVVSLIAVSQGNVYYANAGDTAYTAATNNTGDTPPLNYTGLIFSSQNGQNLYFADGINWVYYNPLDQSVNRWSATYGTLPTDSANNTPKLIEKWRGRLALSGLLLDASNIFFSRVNEPTDFEYFPDTDRQGPDQAFALSTGPVGEVGDLIASLCPYSDDLLIIFGDSSIHTLSGDPLMGGQLDLVTNAIGGTWGRCWCMDPYGNVYFMSNKMGLYVFSPGKQPQRISQPVEKRFKDIDTGANGICLGWDDKFQTLLLFITPLDAPAVTSHYMFEQRTQAWFPIEFANKNHSPLVCCTFDGNEPGDRTLLLGSWDGYVRKFDADATDDDGKPIASEVFIGPLTTKELDDIVLQSVTPILGEESGDVNYAIYVGRTAEAALSSDPVQTGTWKSGRRYTNLIRRAGHALYVKLSSTDRWMMEQIRAVLETKGKIRARGR